MYLFSGLFQISDFSSIFWGNGGRWGFRIIGGNGRSKQIIIEGGGGGGGVCWSQRVKGGVVRQMGFGGEV